MKKLAALAFLAVSMPACTNTYVGEYTANPATGEVWYLRYTTKQIPLIQPAPQIVAQDLYYCAPATGPSPQNCYRAAMPGVTKGKKK